MSFQSALSGRAPHRAATARAARTATYAPGMGRRRSINPCPLVETGRKDDRASDVLIFANLELNLKPLPEEKTGGLRGHAFVLARRHRRASVVRTKLQRAETQALHSDAHLRCIDGEYPIQAWGA
jgi:hypothetical protein